MSHQRIPMPARRAEKAKAPSIIADGQITPADFDAAADALVSAANALRDAARQWRAASPDSDPARISRAQAVHFLLRVQSPLMAAQTALVRLAAKVQASK